MYLDPENPVNTNIHFAAQFIKGSFPVLIVHNQYNQKSAVSPQFAVEVIEECPVQTSIIFFDLTDPFLIEEHSCKEKVKAVYHFIDTKSKEQFTIDYSSICKEIKFIEYEYDSEQFQHLRYRCEDILFQVKPSDIKKTKLKKINQELLHSKAMKKYFDANPKEKQQVIDTINANSIHNYRPSVGFLPSYLVHESNKNNVVQFAIEESYFTGKKRKKPKREYERKKKFNDEDSDYSEKEENKENKEASQSNTKIENNEQSDDSDDNDEKDQNNE